MASRISQVFVAIFSQSHDTLSIFLFVVSPNNQCTTPGAGVGEGGKPGQPGENCVPQGNVLTETDGNMITITFSSIVTKVISIGLLNVADGDTSAAITALTSTTTVRVPNLGENSVQIVPIDTEDVSSIKLTLSGLVALTSVDFCIEPETPAPFLSGPPALTPPTTPTVAPPTGTTPTTPSVTPPTTPATSLPTPTPPPICVEATISFDTLPDDTQLQGGDYLDDEYLAYYGFTVSAIGGLGALPRLFNTTDFGEGTSRNLALGRYAIL